MGILRQMWWALVGPPVQPVMPELPDPADVPREEWNEVVTARAACGLKPWPNLPDSDYSNTVIGTCSTCGIKIYGGQPICFGWTDDEESDVRCEEHTDA